MIPLVFWTYVVFEIILMVIIGNVLGLGVLLLEFLLSFIVGVVFLVRTNDLLFLTLKKLARREKQDFIFGNLKRVVGAFLLILPGILSDIVGIVLILQSFKKSSKIKSDPVEPKEVIDVEIIE